MVRDVSIQAKRSRLSFGLIGFMLFVLFLWQNAWSDKDAIRHDMTSYYAYLNALVFHHDLSLSFDDGSFGDQFAWSSPAENGKIIRMTMGVSLLESPFMFLADMLARLFNMERTAYAPIYVFFLFFGSFLYMLWGLWYSFKLVAACFNAQIAFWVTLALVLGSNLFYYTYEEALMSHSFNFFLYAALLYYTCSWHQSPKMASAARIGIILGFLILIRPIHVLAILIPLFYQGQYQAKWLMMAQHYKQILMLALCCFVVISPQLMYWKYVTVNWIHYSYGDEKFFFDAPMILKGLFGFRKGWFIYTPLMFLAFVGIWPFLRRNPSFILPFFLFLPAYVYVVFSWWCWWYGGGFGCRPMIDILPLMALPLAGLLYFFSGIRRIPAILILILGIGLNLFQTRQYKSSLLHWDGMTWPLYKTIFLKNTWPPDYDKLISPPDYSAAKAGNRDI